MSSTELPKDREVAELAAKARDHITSHGWRQGDYWSGASFDYDRYDGGRVCLLGGAAVAAKITGASLLASVVVSSDHPVGRLARTICDLLGLDPRPGSSIFGQIGEWNDEGVRTQDEVLAVLDEVATKTMPDETGGTL